MTYKTKAIVLKSKIWPRGARLFTLYTEQFGKVKAVAISVDKIKSKVAGHLQPFCLTEVMFAKGRYVDRLAQARLIHSYSHFNQNFFSLLHGSYILEVIEQLTQDGVADKMIWHLLLEVFSQIDEEETWNETVIRFDLLVRLFALRILDHIGYRPELYHCLACKKRIKPENINFSLSQSGVICGQCQFQHLEAVSVSIDLVKLFRSSLSQSLSEVARLLISTSTSKQAIVLIDRLVAMQTQRPLLSSIFIESIQNQEILL